MNGDMLL